MNPPGLIFSYLQSKGTILSLIGDMIILSGVVFLNWNAARAIVFICLDVEIMVILYIIFLKIEEPISGAMIKFGGVIIFTSLMFGYCFSIMQIQYDVNVSDKKLWSDFKNLLYPYYDISLFVILSAFAHIDTIIKLYKAPESMAKYKFQVKAVIYRMLMIPATLIAGGFISAFFGLNVYTAPLLAFLVVKEILEYWKYKALTQLSVTSIAQQAIQET